MPDLDALLRALTPGGGPELEDFVSASPADLPTFSGGAKEAWGEGGGGVLECRIFVDGVTPSSDPKEARAALRSVREAILASVARERGASGELEGRHLWHHEPFTIDEVYPAVPGGGKSGQEEEREKRQAGHCPESSKLREETGRRDQGLKASFKPSSAEAGRRFSAFTGAASLPAQRDFSSSWISG